MIKRIFKKSNSKMKYESPKKRKQTTSLLKIQLNLDKKTELDIIGQLKSQFLLYMIINLKIAK